MRVSGWLLSLADRLEPSADPVGHRPQVHAHAR
jgi:hypothetical protein